MSKYQEVLKGLREEIVSKITTGVWNSNKIENCLQILQEAIDKAIIYDNKEKGIYVKYTTTGISYCGNCGNTTLHNYLGNKMIYCSRCGYKIIWRKDK